MDHSFQLGDCINKIKGEISKLGINSDTQRAGLRQYLGSSFPTNTSKPSFESCMTAIRTEFNLVEFKSHPTSNIRNLLKCDEEVNNSLHTLFYFPVASYVSKIARNVIKILVGISIRVDIRVALLNFYVIKNNLIDKNTSSLINMIMLVTRRVLYTTYYREEEVLKIVF